MSGGPTCVFVNTYYQAFVEHHYSQKPDLSQRAYAEQHQSLVATRFGDSDFYSRGLGTHGWQTIDLVANVAALQMAWAKEHPSTGGHSSLVDILVAQIDQIRPDVVYLQDISMGTNTLLSRLRPLCELIVGQIASPVPARAALDKFDIIISSFPHFVDRFRRDGMVSLYQPLAFPAAQLAADLGDDALSTSKTDHRDIPVSFIGGISAIHNTGNNLLCRLAKESEIGFWGYGAASLPPVSPIAQKHNGPLWGLDMFRHYGRSRITLNRHADVAENHANNMRLFEATGCGALLITDHKDNLSDLFEIGKEVVSYRDADECIELIHYFNANQEAAKTIAAAGQRRTLRDHTYDQRMGQTAEFLAGQLARRRRARAGELAGSAASPPVSTGHEIISETEITAGQIAAWQQPEVATRQRQLVERELDEMYRGQLVPPFQALADAIRPFISSGTKMLEIGCASGYYFEVLSYLLSGTRFEYTGVDYSEPLIEMAQRIYTDSGPTSRFETGDGANLRFADRAFDVAISSCVILHTPNYADHIKETCRLAARHLVLHRTPLCKKHETFRMRKQGYGVEMVELRFNETELLTLCSDHGFFPIARYDLEHDPSRDLYCSTIVLERQEQLDDFAPQTCATFDRTMAWHRDYRLDTQKLSDSSALTALGSLPHLFAGMGASIDALSGIGIAPDRALRQWVEQLPDDANGALCRNLSASSPERLRHAAQRLIDKLPDAGAMAKETLAWLQNDRAREYVTYELTTPGEMVMQAFVASITGLSHERVEALFAELRGFAPLWDTARAAATESSELASATPALARQLAYYAIARARRPRSILAFGHGDGQTAMALKTAIHHNQQHGRASGRFSLTGPGAELGSLADNYAHEYSRVFDPDVDNALALLARIEMVVISAPLSETDEASFYDRVWGHLAPEAIVISDNVGDSGALVSLARHRSLEFRSFDERPAGSFVQGRTVGLITCAGEVRDR